MFGDNCLVAFNTQFMDADLHNIMVGNDITNNELPVIIGEHVWICSNVNVMKGSFLPSNCIIGTGSLIHKRFENENCIIAGNPARIVKYEVDWSQ